MRKQVKVDMLVGVEGVQSEFVRSR